MNPTLAVIIRFLAILALMLVNGMAMIYMLRKVLGHLHLRYGPLHLGWHGLLQIFNDVLKLFTKEDITPKAVDRALFALAPAVVTVPSLLAYLALPFSDTIAATRLETGLLFTFTVLSIVPIGILMAGWASGNKWSLIGGVRSAAQQIAYEVPLLLSVLPVVMLTGTLNLGDLVAAQAGGWSVGWLSWLPHWFITNPIIWPAFIIFVIAALVEGNQTPFDLAEGESELVAGFSTEYSSMKFGLMYLSEFSNQFIMSAVAVTVFFGGWLLPWAPMSWYEAVPILAPAVFLIKTYIGIFVMMWIRGTLPRVRIDALMNLGWKWLIPATLVLILITGILHKVVGL